MGLADSPRHHGKAEAQQSSLFLTPEEVSQTSGRSTAPSQAPKQDATARLKTLTLDAILFQNPSTWTLWLNGVRISSEAQQKQSIPGVSLIKVEEESITVAIDQAGQQRVVRLFPGKTYVIP